MSRKLYQALYSNGEDYVEMKLDGGGISPEEFKEECVDLVPERIFCTNDFVMIKFTSKKASITSLDKQKNKSTRDLMLFMKKRITYIDFIFLTILRLVLLMLKTSF